jgi:hypothetical protein
MRLIRRVVSGGPSRREVEVDPVTDGSKLDFSGHLLFYPLDFLDAERRMAKRWKRGKISRREPGPARVDERGQPGPTYTFRIDWNPLPPGVEKMHAAAVALMTDGKEDWGQKALDEAYAELRRVPLTSLTPNSCRVVVRSAFVPLAYQQFMEIDRFADGRMGSTNEQKELIKLRLPNATIVRRFSEADPFVRVARMYSSAERVRNYWTFVTGVAIPVVAVVASPQYLAPLRMECSPERYAPNESPKSPEESAKIIQAFENASRRTESLLDAESPDSPQGRAISLVGEAIWTQDAEERFFYSWRALEVVANRDLREVRKQVESGNRDAAVPYFRMGAATLVESGATRLDPFVKVAVSLAARAPEVPLSDVEEYYRLRNAIAHGDVSTVDQAEILRRSGMITGLALKVVNDLLKQGAAATDFATTEKDATASTPHAAKDRTED